MADENGDPTLVPLALITGLPSFASYDETTRIFTFTPPFPSTGDPFVITYYTYDNKL
jgi:hypothetical protein